jgi:zinc protease
LPEDYYNTYTATALAVTPAQLNALAARVVLPRQPVWIVVGDMSKIEAPIRALNLGTVRRIDVNGMPLQ